MSFLSKIDKHIVTLVIVGVVTVGALGFMLLLLAGNQERNAIPTDPSETADAAEKTGQPTEEGVSPEAQALFNAKVDTINDQTGVAKLLAVMELRKNIGDYRVELNVKGDSKNMVIQFKKTVSNEDVAEFDKKMQKYAQQILALVPDANEVKWAYTVKDENGGQKLSTVNLNEKTTTPEVETNIKEFGASAKKIEELLSLQKES